MITLNCCQTDASRFQFFKNGNPSVGKKTALTPVPAVGLPKVDGVMRLSQSGKTKVKVDPAPGSLSASKVPPCSSMVRRVMSRPRPALPLVPRSP